MDGEAPEPAPGPARRSFAALIGIAILVGAVILGLISMRRTLLNPLSEEAVLETQVVHVAASVPGRINAIAVKDNAPVRRGQLLFSIDPTVYQLRVEQARAQLASIQATGGSQKQTSAAAAYNARIADEQVARARSNLALATNTLNRLLPLLPNGYVSKQQVDEATTAKRNAEISLKEAYKQSAAAYALILGPGAANAQVVSARAGVAIAEQELANTRVLAPFDGRVGGLTVAPGEFVIPGQSVFTLIDTAHWHASALYRETELKHIKVGSCATVYVMADSSRPVRGRVESIGSGVTPTDTINLPRNLPIVQKSLNWVRVEQRFPVRIALIDPPQSLMRIGASATVVVTNDGC